MACTFHLSKCHQDLTPVIFLGECAGLNAEFTGGIHDLLPKSSLALPHGLAPTVMTYETQPGCCTWAGLSWDKLDLALHFFPS